MGLTEAPLTLARNRLRDGVYGLPEIFGHDDHVDLLVPEGEEIDLAEVFDTGVALDQG